MRVLQLISSAGYYGAEAVVVSLSRKLQELGVESTLGLFENRHRPNLELAKVAEEQGLPAEIFVCRGQIDWRTVQQIRSYLQRNDVQVLHLHGYKSSVYGYLAARTLSCRLVATCHGARTRYSESGYRSLADIRQLLYGAMDAAMLRRCARVVAVSQELAESLRRAKVVPRVDVVCNGVDAERFNSAAPARISKS